MAPWNNDYVVGLFQACYGPRGRNRECELVDNKLLYQMYIYYISDLVIYLMGQIAPVKYPVSNGNNWQDNRNILGIHLDNYIVKFIMPVA